MRFRSVTRRDMLTLEDMAMDAEKLNEEPIYYPPQKAAELLACSVGHLRNLERDKVLIPLRHKRWVRYSAADLRTLRDKLATKAS